MASPAGPFQEALAAFETELDRARDDEARAIEDLLGVADEIDDIEDPEVGDLAP